MSSGRSYSIDFIKGIAAILVVCLHCANNDAFDSVIHLAGRMAVPMFFLISGYYLPSMIQSGRLGGHIRKILKIALGGALLYFVLYGIEDAARGRLRAFLAQLIDWKDLWRTLLMGRFPISVHAGHLWFLIAELYVLGFLGWFAGRHPVRKLYPLIPVLFLCGYLISSFDRDLSLRPYYQNYLFTGFPYILLGSWIRERKPLDRLPSRTVWLLALLAALLYGAEIGFYLWTGLPPRREHYLSIIPLDSLILILAARNGGFARDSFIPSIGRDLSAYVYVVHFYIVGKVWYLFNGGSVESKLQMLVSILLSLLASSIYVRIRRAWTSRAASG